MEAERQMQEIDKKVTEILYLLTGTGMDKKQGLIYQFEMEQENNVALKKRVEKLEKWRDRFVYILIGMALPAGYGIAGLIHSLLNFK